MSSVNAPNDPREAALMRALQRSFPVTDDPWSTLGASAEMTGPEALDAIRRWDADGILREVSAVLEGQALGWDSALVAGTVAPDDIERVAAIVSEHPTVTHNYLRNHEKNLWFTIASPPGVAVERHLGVLAELTGNHSYQPLRRTQTFKIGVVFDPTTGRNKSKVSLADSIEPFEPGPMDRKMLAAVQQPLPLQPDPWGNRASESGVARDALLDFVNTNLGGVIRRVTGTLRHRKMGVGANGMAVWPVPKDTLADVGPKLAAVDEVSHCYARNTIEGFPYSLYGMMHARTRDEVIGLVAKVTDELSLPTGDVLFSERQFKKCRLRYFTPEFEAYCHKHGLGGVS